MLRPCEVFNQLQTAQTSQILRLKQNFKMNTASFGQSIKEVKSEAPLQEMAFKLNTLSWILLFQTLNNVVLLLLVQCHDL